MFVTDKNKQTKNNTYYLKLIFLMRNYQNHNLIFQIWLVSCFDIQNKIKFEKMLCFKINPTGLIKIETTEIVDNLNSNLIITSEGLKIRKHQLRFN